MGSQKQKINLKKLNKPLLLKEAEVMSIELTELREELNLIKRTTIVEPKLNQEKNRQQQQNTDLQ